MENQKNTDPYEYAAHWLPANKATAPTLLQRLNKAIKRKIAYIWLKYF